MEKKSIELIEKRICNCKTKLSVELESVSVGTYSQLTEQEKIPFRVRQAEIQSLKELLFNQDLNKYLDECIEKEYFCMAEGIKIVRNWAIENNIF